MGAAEIRKPLTKLAEVAAKRDQEAVIVACTELSERLSAIEDELTQPTLAEGDNKSFRNPPMIYGKLSMLSGDISGSVDLSPNQQQRELSAVLKERLMAVTVRFEEVISTLPTSNRPLAANGLAVIPRADD
jgi:hypothetical protein